MMYYIIDYYSYSKAKILREDNPEYMKISKSGWTKRAGPFRYPYAAKIRLFKNRENALMAHLEYAKHMSDNETYNYTSREILLKEYGGELSKVQKALLKLKSKYPEEFI